MNADEKAQIILENLDEYVQVNYNFEKYYLRAIKKGLKEIENREQKMKSDQLKRERRD